MPKKPTWAGVSIAVGGQIKVEGGGGLILVEWNIVCDVAGYEILY